MKTLRFLMRERRNAPTTRGAFLLSACHGGTLDPEVTAKLKELYPQDAATGFKVGDLRGAFTIRQGP